jgi:hypothetical protein
VRRLAERSRQRYLRVMQRDVPRASVRVGLRARKQRVCGDDFLEGGSVAYFLPTSSQAHGHFAHRRKRSSTPPTAGWVNSTTSIPQASSTSWASTVNPTCTLNYGENGGGATRHLVGEPNHGLEYMFITMNAARFSMTAQALAIAACAREGALAVARSRKQFARSGTDHGNNLRP